MKNFANYDIIRVFNSSNFEKNVKTAIEKFGNKFGVVIKANSYGIGMQNTLPILKKNGVRHYFCQDIIEALEAKNILGSASGINVYTFAGIQRGQEMEFMNNDIIPICVSWEQIKIYGKFARTLSTKLKIGVHFDTGMNRTGLTLDDVEYLAQNWDSISKYLDIVLYVSHLHSSYSVKSVENKKQLDKFNEILKKLPKRPVSFAATGGSFKLSEEYQYDIVRVGYGIYGMLNEMKTVLSVYAKILQIRDVKKGEKIGYFGAYKANKDMRIAVVNIGYKDGYLRSLSLSNTWRDKIRAKLHSGAGFTNAFMYALGQYKCPVVGIISMNNTIIDVSSVPGKDLSEGMFVEVVGKNANPMKFREANGFIPCELLTSLTVQNPNAVDMTNKEFESLKLEV